MSAQATNPLSLQREATPEGPGSASGAPYLPKAFANTFTSRYVDIRELRLHAVIGGKGPPLILVHGWPQTWYQWRLVMPALARDFTVVAVDQRGVGLSDKPAERIRRGRSSQGYGRVDGRARLQAVRYDRLRHWHADRLRAGCRSPRSGSNVWS